MTLAFEPDELEAIADAARRVMQVGDATLAADARSAIRKLAFDLPLGAPDGDADALLVPSTRRADPHILATLGDALFRRKSVTFHYQGMGGDKESDRTTEPYGLFFISGHWYLVAPDTGEHALRNFRVSRMTTVRPNTHKPGTTDYDIPATFSLREHRPEDAPRGMDFLYSLNRLNVATSRARCLVVITASGLLFEPECRTPRQM